ncbi:MAG: magnesium transporter [Opitutales bacterium]|nr:magnesium transporter [Opitutales bacterium]
MEPTVVSTQINDQPNLYTVESLMAWPREELDKLDVDKLQATSCVVVAQFLERLEIDERRHVLRLLPIESAANILAEMDEEDAAEVVSAMRENRAVEILEDFWPDDAADIVAELDDEDRDRLLDKMDDESAEAVKDLLAYDAETAGGIMTPDVDTTLENQTVDEAIERIRSFTDLHEDLHYVYVVDEEHRLKGVISLRKLIQARPSQRIGELMQTVLKGVVTPETDREEVALIMAEYNLADLAVVDKNNVLLGVVTHDDIIDILQEEATEDIQKLAGAGGDESIHDEISYAIKRRIPWLQVNLFTAFIASSVVLLFGKQIGQLPLLAAFMPIIAGIGGNSGQQALAVAIRSLALGEIHDDDTRGILVKQLAIGLFNGIAIGLIAALVAFLITGEKRLALAVSLAMPINMGLAGFSGALIPLILKKLNRDPAQSSSIFLTAITDTGGFLIFLTLGTLLML